MTLSLSTGFPFENLKAICWMHMQMSGHEYERPAVYDNQSARAGEQEIHKPAGASTADPLSDF